MNYYVVSIRTKEILKLFESYAIDKKLRWSFDGPLVKSLRTIEHSTLFLMGEGYIWETSSSWEADSFISHYRQNYKIIEIDAISLLKPIYGEV